MNTLCESLVNDRPGWADKQVMVNGWKSRSLRGVLTLLCVLTSSSVFADAGVTYHGRLLKPNGEAVTSSSVQFRLQIRTPAPTNCLMYEEVHVEDLSQSQGVFSITLNDGTQSSSNTEPFTLERVFRNTGNTITFPVGKCSGSDSVTFVSTLSRQLVVSFNDGAFSGWEPLPAQAINFVPSSLESVSVGGRTPMNFFRVEEPSGPQTMDPWTAVNYQKLLDLVGNTTISGGVASIGGRASGFTGALAGDVTGGQSTTRVERLQGRDVSNSLPADGQFLKWNNALSQWEPGNVPVAGNPDWADITNKPTSLPPNGSASGDLTGTYPNPTIANNAVTSGKIADGAVAFSKIAAGSVTGQVLRYEVGTGWSPTKLNYVDLVNNVGGSPWPGVCAAGSFINWNSGTDAFECVALTNAMVAGALTTLPVSKGGTGATTEQAARNNLLPVQTGNAGKILQTDGTNVSWEDAPSTGINSINGATGNSQTFQTSQNNTAPTFTRSGNTHTLEIPQASVNGVTAGTISYTDFQNFTGKQSALGFTPLNPANNLSELASAATARTNLGLGTAATKNFGTSAGNLVELDGSARIPASLLPSLSGTYFTQGGNAFGAPAVLGTTDTQPLHLRTGGTNRLTILDTGNVGIGTTSPGARLTAVGGATFDVSAGGTHGQVVVASSGAVAGQGGLLLTQYTNYAAASEGFKFYTLGTGTVGSGRLKIAQVVNSAPDTVNDLVTIHSNGNFGIGAPNPTEKLEVAGNIKATQVCIGTDCRSAWPGTGGGGTVTSVATGTGLTGGPITGSGTISIASGGVGTTQLAAAAVTTAKIGDGQVTGLKLETISGLTNGTYGSSTEIPSITIDTKGRITAISTNTVSALPAASGVSGKFLKSNGTAWSGQDILFSDIKNSLGSSAFSLAGCGPSKTVQWSSLTDSFSCQDIDNLDAGKITTGTLSASRLPTSITNALWTESSGNVYRASGNVGIGTTSPSTQLEVTGTIKGSGPLWSSYGVTGTHRGLILENFDNTASAHGVDLGAKLGAIEFQGLSWAKETAWTTASASNAKNAMLQFGVLSEGAPSVPMVLRANGSVGVGTTSPLAAIHALSVTSKELARFTYISSSAEESAVRLQKARGTAGSLSIVNSGDSLGGVVGQGYDGANYVNAGAVVVESDGTPGSNDMPGRLTFHTTPDGSSLLAERMRITNTGYVGIGTTNPQAKLHVEGFIQTLDGASAYNGWGVSPVSNLLSTTDLDYNRALGNRIYRINNHTGISMSAHSSYGGIRFYNQGYENGKINPYDSTLISPPKMVMAINNGSVGIGTASPSYTLHVVGSAGLSSGTAWTNASDSRLKDIHGDYERGLEEVLQLHTVLYNYKKDNALGLPSDFVKTGFIAQEVQKVIPEAVNKRKDGFLELNVDPIHWAVVNAIKDFYQRWFKDSEALRREIAAIKTESILKDQRIQKIEKENAEKEGKLLMMQVYLCKKDPAADFCR